MTAERRSGPLAAELLTALAGLPVGLVVVTMEYGLASAACVASTAAEVVAVCRAHAPDPTPDFPAAEVIPLRGGPIGPQT